MPENDAMNAFTNLGDPITRYMTVMYSSSFWTQTPNVDNFTHHMNDSGYSSFIQTQTLAFNHQYRLKSIHGVTAQKMKLGQTTERTIAGINAPVAGAGTTIAIISDGNGNHVSTYSRMYPASPEDMQRYHKHLNKLWVKHGGNPLQEVSFPAGFSVYKTPRPVGSTRPDIYIYGHRESRR